MKRIDAKVYLTLFVLSFFAEIYFVSQSDKDVLSILGTAVVIFVSMCIAIDSFQSHLEMTYKELIHSIDPTQTISLQEVTKVEESRKKETVAVHENEEINSLDDKYEEFFKENFLRIETVNKAVYVSLKKNMGEMGAEIEKLQKGLQLIEEIHNDSTEEIIHLSNQILEENKKIYESQKKIYESLENLAKANQEQ